MKEIANKNFKRLRYEIREIVSVAKEIEKLGQKVIWENIGDPIEKGEKVPEIIKKIVQRAAKHDLLYAYSPTKGLEKTREFLANLVNQRRKVKITKEEIIFFNGLGDAINKLYHCLDKNARIIMPSPGYPAHFSQEALHSEKEPIFYELDPKNHWYPNLHDLEMKIKSNSQIVGILIINPNNPTGICWPKKYLLEIVKLAKRYKLFLIGDEVYENMTFGTTPFTPLSDVVGKVPAVSLKGISKIFPWPGARCGWLEFYNLKEDKNFQNYFENIIKSKQIEVCSTTLPQFVIPEIMNNPEYKRFFKERLKNYQRKAEILESIFKEIKEIIFVKPDAAFYATIVFRENVLNEGQELKIESKVIKKFVQEKIKEKIPRDRRFVYYLLGATGICLVPLSGFYSKYLGFRMTLLEPQVKKFKQLAITIREKILEYINSQKNESKVLCYNFRKSSGSVF